MFKTLLYQANANSKLLNRYRNVWYLTKSILNMKENNYCTIVWAFNKNPRWTFSDDDFAITILISSQFNADCAIFTIKTTTRFLVINETLNIFFFKYFVNKMVLLHNNTTYIFADCAIDDKNHSSVAGLPSKRPQSPPQCICIQHQPLSLHFKEHEYETNVIW